MDVDDRKLAHIARSTGPRTGLKLAGSDRAHSQADPVAGNNGLQDIEDFVDNGIREMGSGRECMLGVEDTASGRG
jgi:hypothetical protein